MAHFAKIEDGTVTQVIVVHNNELLNAAGVEEEALGVAFCVGLLGGEWKQTSYNSNFRKNYAGIGFTYDTKLDAFIPPAPFPSWTLDKEKCQWAPPTPYPTDKGAQYWDESTLAWVAYATPILEAPAAE